MRSLGIFLGVKPTAGGMFQYAQSLLDALRFLYEDGYKVQVAYVASSWESVLSSYPFEKIQIRAGRFGLFVAELTMILRIPGSFARYFTWWFNPISIQLFRQDCNVWIFPAQDAISYQVRLRVIATVHDLMHRYEPFFPEVSMNNRRAIREHRFRSLVDWAQLVLVDSSIGRKHVMESYGTDSKKIFPLPYVPPRYILDGKEPEDFDRRYILPEKFIFYPAQFWAHKNHKILISAASALRTQFPDICLLFSGKKDHEYMDIKNYTLQIGMTDRVIFVGYVPGRDLVGFYRRARAMIMPTFFGPTNIPPLEAFVCGCPTAVSNIYGMPEQVGNAALLFDPHSVEEVTRVMKTLWENDEMCKQLIANGNLKALHWGLKQFGETLTNIINSWDWENRIS